MMNEAALRRHRMLNRLQTLLLIAGMAALVSGVGYVIGGRGYAFLSVGLVVLLFAFNPALSPRLAMRILRGFRLDYRQAAPLYRILRTLSARAGLPAVPELYYIPTPIMNAFAVGRPEQAAIGISAGLLRVMTPRQIAAILAHEVSHIAHNDMRTMGFADLTHRFTLFMSILGQILLVINLPLLLWTEYHVSWLAILLLVLSPTLSALLQGALSRNREYEADRFGAALVGDPAALASALALMERYQGGFIEQILFPNRHRRMPWLLRTHPPTPKRILRLQELQARPIPGDWEPIRYPQENTTYPSVGRPLRGPFRDRFR